MRWLKALLFISVSLNIAFIVGYLYSDQYLYNLKTSPEKRQKALHQRLDFSSAQKDIFIALKTHAIELTADYKDKDKQLLKRYWAILETYPGSAEAENNLDEILKQMSQEQLDYRKEVTEDFKQLMKNINTEQKKKLVQILKRKNVFLRLMKLKPVAKKSASVKNTQEL